ncbi:methylated-DNA--[protein]-cysteine S-methyltransferase, partial [Francisella tularensis subsp. holarctica]|uniref:methylated-DNA--[protein]-cysteine S-methyltransferase n=1 Tax=Francisella tularensis TaxID=263 RepID=UPI002381A243
GETISYRKEATNIGKPTALRAVANANGKNLLPIIIPCHRLINTNGKLGGYTSGLYKKEFLLNIEHSILIHKN